MREALLAELADVGVERFTASDYRPGTVTHIVLIRFAAGVGVHERAEAQRRFLDLITTERNGSRYITSIAGGEQRSGEPNNEFDAGFVLTFASLGDRNFYVGEPIVTDPAFYDTVHAQFKQYLAPLVAPDRPAVEVLDFV